MRMPVLLLVPLLAAVMIIGLACEKSTEANAPRSSEVVTIAVASSRVAPVQREVKVVGTLYGDEEATVSAKVPGRITQILLDVGDRVAAGQALAQIDRTDYELSAAQKRMAVQAALAKLGLDDFPPESFELNRIPTVERARLQSANAEAKFKRGQQLFQQNPPLISEQDFADLQTAFEVARSNYEVELLTAKSQLADARSRQTELNQDLQRLRDATVVAPLADTPTSAVATTATSAPAGGQYAIAARLVSIGEYVREGTPLFRLVADNPIKYRPTVAEKFLGQVKTGQAVRLRIEAFDDVFTGTVSRISPQVEMAGRSFQVEILVPNGDGRLHPGAFAEGAILTRTDPQVTMMPRAALVTFAGVTKVFTVADGKAVEMKVETGQVVGDEIEIVSGLKGAMPVVTDGAGRLASGTPVKIQQGPSTRSAS